MHYCARDSVLKERSIGREPYIRTDLQQGSGRLLAVETLREAYANQRQRGGRSFIIDALKSISNYCPMY